MFEPCDVVLNHLDHVNLLVSCIDFEWLVQELVCLEFRYPELIDVIPKRNLKLNSFERWFNFILGFLFGSFQFHQVFNNLVFTWYNVDNIILMSSLLEVTEVNYFLLIGPTPHLGPQVDHCSLPCFPYIFVQHVVGFGYNIVVYCDLLLDPRNAVVVILHLVLSLFEDQVPLCLAFQIVDLGPFSD